MPNSPPSPTALLPSIAPLPPVFVEEESKICLENPRGHPFGERSESRKKVDHPSGWDGPAPGCPKMQIPPVLGDVVTRKGDPSLLLHPREDVVMTDDCGRAVKTIAVGEAAITTTDAFQSSSSSSSSKVFNGNRCDGNYGGQENARSLTYPPFSPPMALSIDTRVASSAAVVGKSLEQPVHGEMQGLPEQPFSPSVAQSADILLQYVTALASSDGQTNLSSFSSFSSSSSSTTTSTTPATTTNNHNATTAAAQEPTSPMEIDSSARAEETSSGAIGGEGGHATISNGRAAVREFMENLTTLSAYIDHAVRRVPPELHHRLDVEVPCDWNVNAMTGYIQGFLSASLAEK